MIKQGIISYFCIINLLSVTLFLKHLYLHVKNNKIEQKRNNSYTYYNHFKRRIICLLKCDDIMTKYWGKSNNTVGIIFLPLPLNNNL